MTDLKTLKDFDYLKISNKAPKDDKFIFIDDLRQEATKWIKCWRTMQKNEKDEKIFNWWTARIDAFKEFFNITEEDLK